MQRPLLPDEVSVCSDATTLVGTMGCWCLCRRPEIEERERRRGFVPGLPTVEKVGRTLSRLRDSPMSRRLSIMSSVTIRSDETLPERAWWSRVPQPMHRLEKDMPNTRLATQVLKVACERTPLKEPGRGYDFDWYGRYMPKESLEEGQNYLLVALICGKVTFIALSKVVDTIYDDICTGDFLNDCLKLVVTPVNLALPVPVKGPREAATVGRFFAKNAHFFRSGGGGVSRATLVIDLYSVLVLRLTLPKLAFSAGRIVDFHFVSYKHGASLASLRIATTKLLVSTMKAIAP